MLELIEPVAVFLAAVCSIVAAVLALEIGAAVAGPEKFSNSRLARRHRQVTILIPAHNEEEGIRETLAALRPQLAEGDRVVVIADNCTDETAAITRAEGVDVIERADPGHLGKGYALAYGIRHLIPSNPDVVMALDADCQFAPGAIDMLARTCADTGRPVQSLDLIVVDTDAPLQERVSAFAFRLKNHVRFLGLKRLGLPCPLAGTGMAFPWSVIRSAPLGSGNIVEDMKLGVDLAITGHPAVFEPRATVTSRFPSTEDARKTQRTRWEHGHISTIFREVPRLFWEAFRQRRIDIFGLGLDLLVPPLSLFILLTMALFAVSLVLIVFGGSSVPIVLSSGSLLLVGLSLFAAWYAFGRDLLAPQDLAAVPLYIVGKLPVYMRAICGKEKRWIRTARSSSTGKPDD